MIENFLKEYGAMLFHDFTLAAQCLGISRAEFLSELRKAVERGTVEAKSYGYSGLKVWDLVYIPTEDEVNLVVELLRTKKKLSFSGVVKSQNELGRSQVQAILDKLTIEGVAEKRQVGYVLVESEFLDILAVAKAHSPFTVAGLAKALGSSKYRANKFVEEALKDKTVVKKDGKYKVSSV